MDLTTPAVLRELSADEIDWELGAAPMDVNASEDGADVLAEAVIDALAYRLVALESLDALHRLTGQLNRLTEQNAELRDENRRLRRRQAAAA